MKYLYRSDDGARFTKQSDGKYTMDESSMGMPYRYSYSVLKLHGFVDRLEDCDIARNERRYEGCGENESCDSDN